MAITGNDVVRLQLTDEEIRNCIIVSNNITPYINDRADLHPRDYLERFIDVLLGEIAECMVIKWFHQNNKFAESAVDKASPKPDAGHDIILKTRENREIKCSVKSSLSVFKSSPNDIINQFTIATKQSELRDTNIQVYFWLELSGGNKHRVVVPSTNNVAIIGWVGSKDIKRFSKYATESREAPEEKLNKMRPMNELLDLLA
jgi:hypothetical protein